MFSLSMTTFLRNRINRFYVTAIFETKTRRHDIRTTARLVGQNGFRGPCVKELKIPTA